MISRAVLRWGTTCSRSQAFRVWLKAPCRPGSGSLATGSRHLSNSPQSSSSVEKLRQVPTSPTSSKIIYEGSLTRTFRSLKIFSLSSLSFAVALTPFMFIIDTSLPFVARIVLASTALGTSAVSTALIGWCGQPYVAKVRELSDGNGNGSNPSDLGLNGIQLETLTLTLRPRFTSVHDTAFLVETRRPFAKWELAENVTVEKSNGAGSDTPSEEMVAETIDAQGNVLGRWIVSWSKDGTRGTCRGEGKVQRFFNVHEELLPSLVK